MNAKKITENLEAFKQPITFIINRKY